MTTIYIDTMREIVSPIISETDWITVISSGVSAILGALVGGYYTLKSADKAHLHNLELEKNKQYKQEMTTIVSLAEELKVIMECYQDEFAQLFDTIKNDYYLRTSYIITQEYFTVYKNNADKLGLIQDDVLRNLFIKIHILLNRFIENLKIYDVSYKALLERRINILQTVLPQYFNARLLRGFDVEKGFDEFKKLVKEQEKNSSQNDITARNVQFIENDKLEQDGLHEQSEELKNIFYIIVELNQKIQDKVALIEGRKND